MKPNNDFEVQTVGTAEALKAANNYIKLLEMKGAAATAVDIARNTYRAKLKAAQGAD